MTTQARFLIVEDDAGAVRTLIREVELRSQAVFHTVGSLSEGLRAIYAASGWTGAVFDLFLPTTELPGVLGRSAEVDALTAQYGGFILASAFQDRFPGRPMIIWSLWGGEPGPVEPFVRAGVCKFVDKGNLRISEAGELGAFLMQRAKPAAALRIAWDSIKIAPEIPGVGVGIDLKKLLRDLRDHFGR